MNSRTPPEDTLRERGKARRRRAILHAALRLFAEHGYERTTIHDIAEAAEVAPRTVTGYFPSKLDFIAEWPSVQARRMVELYEASPGISFPDLVDAWWTDARTSIDPQEAALTRAMALRNPGVAAMAEAHVSAGMDEARYALDDLSGGERDDLLQEAGRAAIRSINSVFFRGLGEGRMTDAVQARLLELVRSVITSSRAGHGSLGPPR